jgi:hypothetical protein
MENKTYSYKKFNDMLKMSNELNKINKINPYTDEQFEEDLKKWSSETKRIHNDKLDKEHKLNEFIEHKLNEFIEHLKSKKM